MRERIYTKHVHWDVESVRGYNPGSASDSCYCWPWYSRPTLHCFISLTRMNALSTCMSSPWWSAVGNFQAAPIDASDCAELRTLAIDTKIEVETFYCFLEQLSALVMTYSESAKQQLGSCVVRKEANWVAQKICKIMLQFDHSAGRFSHYRHIQQEAAVCADRLILRSRQKKGNSFLQFIHFILSSGDGSKMQWSTLRVKKKKEKQISVTFVMRINTSYSERRSDIVVTALKYSFSSSSNYSLIHGTMHRLLFLKLEVCIHVMLHKNLTC